MWAFFDSSYSAVNLTKARLDLNPERGDPTKVWMGIVFEEHMVCRLGEGQERGTLRRAMQRDPRPYLV